MLDIIKKHALNMGKDIVDELTKPEKLQQSVVNSGLPLKPEEQTAVGLWLSNYLRGLAYPPLA